MKRIILSIVAVALMFTAFVSCNNQSKEEAMKERVNEESKVIAEVEGRKNFSNLAVITPLPAIMIATYDSNQNPNVMMAAWGGQCGPKQISFTLGAHKTTTNLKESMECTISFATVDDVAESDYFGTVSANDVPDKVQKAGFTAIKSPNVNAPIIEQYPLTLECKVVEFNENEKGGAFVVCDIINMSAKSSILDENGKIDLSKLKPIIFDSSHHSYRVVGEEVGKAWNAGKAIIERDAK